MARKIITFERFQTIFPLTYIFITVFQIQLSMAMSFTLKSITSIFAPIGVLISTIPLSVTIIPLTMVNITILIMKGTLAYSFIFQPLTLEFRTIYVD